MDTSSEYLIEMKLRGDPELYKAMRSSLFAIERMLDSFSMRFPTYTDHSILHSMNVLKYCNCIIGTRGAARLSAEECYVLVMSCYLHDIGMSILDRDYNAFFGQIVSREWLDAHPGIQEDEIVRTFHHEFSGCIIRKYAELFEIPEEYLFPIIQTSRGHRKTDLFDEQEYPLLEINGNSMRLPYLAALVRLADELDWSTDRNSELLYADIELKRLKNSVIFGIHDSIKSVEVDENRIILMVRPETPELVPPIEELAEKIRNTLLYCADVSRERTGLDITQKEVVMT